MKKMGMPASASGDVRSTTLDPASMPGDDTRTTTYDSLEMDTAFAASFGSCCIIGRNIVFAQVSWQTIEHSSGVTLILRKLGLSSSDRPLSLSSTEAPPLS